VKVRGPQEIQGGQGEAEPGASGRARGAESGVARRSDDDGHAVDRGEAGRVFVPGRRLELGSRVVRRVVVVAASRGLKLDGLAGGPLDRSETGARGAPVGAVSGAKGMPRSTARWKKEALGSSQVGGKCGPGQPFQVWRSSGKCP